MNVWSRLGTREPSPQAGGVLGADRSFGGWWSVGAGMPINPLDMESSFEAVRPASSGCHSPVGPLSWLTSWIGAPPAAGAGGTLPGVGSAARSWAEPAAGTPLDSPGPRALTQSAGPAVGWGHELPIGCRAIELPH